MEVDIVNQIRAARALLDWTQTDLADASGLSQTGIARIENRTNKPNANTLHKIREALYAGGVTFINNGVQFLCNCEREKYAEQKARLEQVENSEAQVQQAAEA